MAITRAQQAKQLLAQGGRIGLKGGADASQFDKPRSEQKTPNVSAGGASFNELDDAPSGEEIKRAREEFETSVGKSNLEKLKKEGVPKSNMPGVLGLGLNATKKLRDFTLKKNIDYFEGLKSRNRLQDYPPTLEGYTQYMQDRSAGLIDAAGNTIPETLRGDRDEPILLSDATGIMDQASKTTDQGTEDDEFEFYRRFRADGGIMGGLADGQMDEMGRQMYGLGKLVKKATRAVKKIVKSPIGKAALLYTGAAMAGSFGAGKGLFSAGMFKPAAIKAGLFGQAMAPGFAGPGIPGLFTKLGLTKTAGSLMPTGLGAITAATAIAGLLTPAQEEEAQRISDETGIDIEEIRANPDKYLARRFRADGGLMRLGYQEGGDAEPVAKKTMPLLDMDGKEKDYRETGGFVDMGRMEKADDVPARLSKNEFVFTADAVRNAGDGSVDKGAEVMYNMMKNLEAGGEVSKESQGLEGARRMFQTSQRLGEVI